MGPWKKYEGNPILQHADGLMGTGHGAPFCCKDGSWKYIFHAHLGFHESTAAHFVYQGFAISDQGTVSIGGSLIRPQVLGSTSPEK